MFATHGIPDVLVSDNGSGFTSQEFDVFMRRNGIRHITTAPSTLGPNVNSFIYYI